MKDTFPAYLYKKSPSASQQTSPDALFNPLNAIDGKQAFTSEFAPDQQLQKKQIFLNYKSFYRVADDTQERALIITKLKDEGFSVYFIFTKGSKPVAVDVDDDLEVKIGSDGKSIFLLNDQDIEKLSNLDNSETIKELSLALDDSIIMSYEQVKEVGEILGMNSWVQKGIYKNHKFMCLLSGLEKVPISDHKGFMKKIIHSIALDQYHFQELTLNFEMMLNYFQLPDIDLNDENIKKLLDYFVLDWQSNYNVNSGFKEYKDNCSLQLLNSLNAIDDPENVKKIFGYWFDKNFLDKQIKTQATITDFQKFLIINFWFYYPDFQELISKAKTIEDYKDKDFHYIAEDLMDWKKSCQQHKISIAISRLSYFQCNLIIQNSFLNKTFWKGEDHYDSMMILKNYYDDVKFSCEDGRLFLIIDQSRIEIDCIEFLKFLKNSKINKEFNTTEVFIEFFNHLPEIKIIHTLGSNYAHDKLGRSSVHHCFMSINGGFDYLPLNLQENYINRLQGVIIDSAETIYNFTQAYNNHFEIRRFMNIIFELICNNPNILKKISFLEIKKKLTKLEEALENFYFPSHSEKLIYDQAYFAFASTTLTILQYNIEKQGAKEMAEKILIKLKGKVCFDLNFDLSPEFVDFLITLHHQGKINLKDFCSESNSLIAKKFWQEQFSSETDKYIKGYVCNIRIPESAYLANYLKIVKLPIESIDSIVVSSRQLNQSPVQFYLVDLNQNSLEETKQLIGSAKLNPIKIVSLNILGFNQYDLTTNLDDSTNLDKRYQLLTEIIKLFPKLKHLRVNKELFELEKILPSLENTKIVFELFEYGSQYFKYYIANDHPIANDSLQDASNNINGGSSVFIANQESVSSPIKSYNNRFTMVEAGKIINRPPRKNHPFYVRDSLFELNTDCRSLRDDWLPKIKCEKEQIDEVKLLTEDRFDQYQIAENLKSTHTFCSFTQNLKAQENKLLSISPDNEIIGYYTYPSSAKIEFKKDEHGFFYATCDQQCQIKYILKGQELDYLTPASELDSLNPKVKQIVQDYIIQPFPLSVDNSDYELPPYLTENINIKVRNKQWLDELFLIKNKGSCRHRIMAMASKFEDNGLLNGKDFLIVGVDNSHLVLAVRCASDWITLNLGGSNSQQTFAVGQTYQTPTPITQTDIETKQQAQSPKITSPSTSPITQEVKPLNVEFIIVRDQIVELYKIKQLNNYKEFQELLISLSNHKDKKSLLLTTNYFQELKNYLLGFKLENIDINAHFIESKKNLIIKKPTIKIQDPKVIISQQTPLSEFISEAESNPEKIYFLIIDWKKFDDKHRVACNTMFDQNSRSIEGINIPDNVKLICIDDAKSIITDPAVLSRFNDSCDLSSIKKEEFDKKISSDEGSELPSKIFEFDCEGGGNWESRLFGRLIVNGNIIQFEKSVFAENLSSLQGNFCKFKFKNFSTTQQLEITEKFQQASVQGFIEYSNYKINFPKNYSLQFDKLEFNFAEIFKSFKASIEDDSDQPSIVIYKDSQPPNKEEIEIVNAHLFDQLLVSSEISGNQYKENPGLIERLKNNTLKLFITEELTPAQSYCLMFNAKKHRVSLEIYLAKNVKFNINFNRFIKAVDNSLAVDHNPLSSSKKSTIKITNNVEKEFISLKEELITSNTDSKVKINLVNVEDVSYSALFSHKTFKVVNQDEHQLVNDEQRHFTFEKKISEVQDKLNNNEIVILKGKFPNDLLALLHPQIIKAHPNLYIIIEEQGIIPASKKSSQLPFLDSNQCSISYHPAESVLPNPQKEIERYTYIEEKIPSNPKQEALEFIKQRKDKLKELLDKNSTLQILGHSGVGKSSLLREVKKNGLQNQGDVEIFEELESFEQWANNNNIKTKILVIDEFNVDGSTNFSMFRDFANAECQSDQGQSNDSMRQIFYKGKFYQLDKNHKVVFLGNPHNYGNRYKHKLFSDCQIQEWQLMDFTVSYIYENILKQPIFDKLGEAIKTKLSPEEFNEIAIKAIQEYYTNNQKPPDDDSGLPQETVRELQEKVLQEIVKKTQQPLKAEVANDNFISTQVNQGSIKQLQTAIQIRQLQRQEDFPSECLGTSGVIFEGDSGVGKSAMIEAVLQNQGIKKITSLQSNDVSNNHCYCKIDASLSSDQIKEQLIEAYELGVIIVIDELNTRINEGLEKVINALLTGQHPIDIKKPTRPGFMIITSVNKAINAGRSNIPPPIKHRCNIISASPLKEYEVEDFVEIMVNWLEKDSSIKASNLKVVKKIAEVFLQLIKEDSNFNLRSLKTKFNEIIDDLRKANQEYSIADNSLKLNLQLNKINTNLLHFSSNEFQGLSGDELDKIRFKKSNFYFRDKNTPISNNQKENIFEALQKAQAQLAISNDDLIKFSILAVKHQGLGNSFEDQNKKEKIANDFKRLFGADYERKKTQSIKFSSEFQKSLLTKGLITARLDGLGKFGMRLKRLDPELLLEFLLKNVKNNVKKEFIKENFLNKINQIINNLDKDLRSSIKSLASQASRCSGR